jgi:protocatechuate 3,4-dioxygenase beta subunit
VTGPTAASAADDPTTLTAADFAALAPCLLTPGQTEGPFYLSADLERRDITEGRPGYPLRLGLRVVDAACVPVPGTRGGRSTSTSWRTSTGRPC